MLSWCTGSSDLKLQLSGLYLKVKAAHVVRVSAGGTGLPKAAGAGRPT